MHFDGSQRIGKTHADSEYFYFGTGAFAAFAWVKFDVGAVPGCCNNVISANNLADSQPGWALFSDTNVFRTRTATNGGAGHIVGNHATLQEQRWYMVGVTRTFPARAV
jgi:hypothetical protein